MNNNGNQEMFNFNKLMQLFAQGQPSKHTKGRQKPKQRKKYKDKSRARYVAKMHRKREKAIAINLAQNMEDPWVIVNESYIKFETEDTVLVSRLIKGQRLIEIRDVEQL